MTAKFKIDFRLFAISEVDRARTNGEDEKDTLMAAWKRRTAKIIHQSARPAGLEPRPTD
jgi:hypothetical protein